jgi:hypothetical protein
MRLFLFLLLSIPALTQVPWTVTAIELNSDTLPALGAQVTWTPVTGAASYSVYRYATSGYETCSTTTVHDAWIEVEDGLTGTTYSDFPAADAYGWGGDWCYGVTATTNGVESAITPTSKPIVLGMGYYFDWAYYSPDCSTRVGNPTGSGTFMLQRTRNGVTQTMPATLITLNIPLRWAGHFRALSTDYFVATFTLPDGKVFTFPNVFLGPSMDGSPIQANWGPYLTLQVNQGNDGICQLSHYGYFQPASNN